MLNHRYPLWITYIFLCAFVSLVFAEGATAEEVNTAAMVSDLLDRSNPAKSREAFMKLRLMLHIHSPEIVAALQDNLGQSLDVVDDYRNVRRIGKVLSVAPTLDAIDSVAELLAVDSAPEVQKAACDAMQNLISGCSSEQKLQAVYVLPQLEEIMRDRELPLPLIDSAVMASAALGESGFDLLIGLRDEPEINKKILNIFCTALSQTDDLRALPILRNIINNNDTREGMRIQAIHGLGQMFARAAKLGLVIDPAERDNCIATLNNFLDHASDQVFSVAFRSLVKIEGVQQDSQLYQLALNSLYSPYKHRRMAALEVLYQSDVVLNEYVISSIQSVVESDPNPDIRITAGAVLDKHQAQIDEPSIP
ncbi:MAG: HEAT repeat domain-containing protein [Planctomycetota bacterium]|jgi:hypothetical protein